MNPARAIRRSAGVLAGIAGALLASLAVTPGHPERASRGPHTSLT